MPRGYARGRIDANHTEIVRALKDFGASVIDCAHVGRGFPDLIVGHARQTILLEIKNPNTQYGRKGLNARQAEWFANWQGGPIAIVDSVEAALRVLKAVTA